MKILVVDDNTVNQNLSRVMLESRGHTVELVGDGKDAVGLLSENSSFDLVVMDIRMPGMNGIDATKKIRKFNQTVPIVALTINDSDDEDIKEKCLKAGMNDFLQKPITPEQFNELIDRWQGKTAGGD